MEHVTHGLSTPPDSQLVDRVASGPIVVRHMLPHCDGIKHGRCGLESDLHNEESSDYSSGLLDPTDRRFRATTIWKKPAPKAAAKVMLSITLAKLGGPTGIRRKVRCSSTSNHFCAQKRSRWGVRKVCGPSGSFSDHRSARSSQNSHLPFGVTASQMPSSLRTLAHSASTASRSATCSNTLIRNRPSNRASLKGSASPTATMRCDRWLLDRRRSISRLRSQAT